MVIGPFCSSKSLSCFDGKICTSINPCSISTFRRTPLSPTLYSISLPTSHNTCEKVPTITSTVANLDPPTRPPRAELSSSPSTILSSTAAAVPTPEPRPPALTMPPSAGEPREKLTFFRGVPSIRVRRCSSDRRCPSLRASSSPLQKSVEQHSSGCKWWPSFRLPPSLLLPLLLLVPGRKFWPSLSRWP